jgi:protein-S-isoprenylcysteine O-methyltransferase Ste14
MNAYTYEQETERSEATSMTSKKALIAATAVFVALTLGGVALALSALLLDDLPRQLVLIGFGAATYGAGLAFFLIQAFAYAAKHNSR